MSQAVVQQYSSATQVQVSQAHPGQPGVSFGMQASVAVTQRPSGVQPEPAGQVPQGFPQPSLPHSFPSQVHVSHAPSRQNAPASQLPQDPPQPSSPQAFPKHFGTHPPPSWRQAR